MDYKKHGFKDEKAFQEEVFDWMKKTNDRMDMTHFKQAVHIYEDLQLYMGRRYLQLLSRGWGWHANQKFPLTSSGWRTYSGMMSRLNLDKIIVSTYMPNATDFMQHAPSYQLLMQYFFGKEKTRLAHREIIDEALAVGTAYGEVDWHKEEFDIIKGVESKGKGFTVKSKKFTLEYPVLKYVPYFNVLRDMAGDRYIGKKIWATRNDIDAKYDISEEMWKKIEGSTPMALNDWNRVKNILNRDLELKQKTSEILNCQLEKIAWDKFSLPNHDDFYSMKGTELYELTEVYLNGYGAKTVKVVYINGFNIYIGDTNLPFNGSPIEQLNFETMPGEKIGYGVGQLARPYQAGADTYYNTYLTAIQIIGGPMFTMDEDLMNEGMSEFKYMPFDIVKKSPGIETLQRIDIIDPKAVQQNLEAIKDLEFRFNNALGLNPYVTGQSGGIERSAEGVRERKRGSDNKIAKFLDNINMFSTKVGEKMALFHRVMGDEIEQELDGEIIKLEPKDIVTGFKITFDGEAILGEREQKVQDTINLLSALAPYNVNKDNEQIISNEKLLKHVFTNIGMEDVIETQDERIKNLQSSVEYQQKKQEILSAITPPPTEDVKESINVSFKDLAPYPQAQIALLKKLGIDMGEPQVEQQAPEQSLPLEQAILPSEEVDNPFM